MSYPKPLIYFRRRSDSLPSTLLPSNLDPASLGIQISSVETWLISGTPTTEFAILGKGPWKSPISPGTINVDNVWSLQGSEVRIYFDSRSSQTAFDPAGVTDCPLVFCGDLHEIRPSEKGQTPFYAYSCSARGLIARGERVPVVSVIDNSDTVRFNINALLNDYQPTTGGKSVGQAISMILTTYAVAYRLNQQGIGNFTLNDSAQTATLPSSTASDLNNLSLVPPFEFRISGDNVIAAIQQVLDVYAPNFTVVVMPDGTLRFPDLRNYQAYDIDLMNQLVDGLSYSKSTLSSYSRVIVRGGPKVVPYYCQWNIPRDNQSYNLDDSPDNSKFNGNMVEYFDYTGNNNTQAKVNYNHANFTWGRILLSVGNVSFSYANGTANLPSNQIRIIPSTGNLPGSNTTSLSNWIADELTMIDNSADSRREARVKVNRNFWMIGTGGAANSIIRKDSGEFLITQNTLANSTVNWSILTTNPNVDRPSSNYNASLYYFTYDYELYGYTRPGSTTWRRYKINLDAISSNNPLTTTQKGMARRIGNIFPQPVDGLNFSQIGNSNSSAGVNQQRKVWYPECLVEYRQRVGSNGTFLYQAFWAGFRTDPVNSQIILSRPAVQDPGNNNGTYTEKTPPWDTGTGNSTNQPFQIVPYNIKVLLPVYEGTQEAVYPHYNANMVPASGESNATVKTRYGIERDLIVTLPEWYDQRDQTSADQYAKDLWDSVEKPIIQGSFLWMDGIPSTEWTYAGVLSNGKIQAFNITSNETCDSTTGSGIEDCSMLLASCQIRFTGSQKPYTAVSFTSARPRTGMPMHDFHTFEETLTRDLTML